MIAKTTLKILAMSDEDWLNKQFRKSNSRNTRNCALTSIKTFDQFCQYETGLNGKSKEQMISQYQEWFNQDKPDIRSICLSLDKFVGFMSEDHEDIVISNNQYSNADFHNTTFKAKTGKTIKLYFGFVKTYLRICHGVRLTNEDIHDYVQFPKDRKEARRSLSLDTLKLFFW